MRELLIAGGIVGSLTALTFARFLVGMAPHISTGVAITLFGLVVGVTGGIGYHLSLIRILEPRDQLSPGWIWNPTRLHARLKRQEKRAVYLWFVMGGSGWLLTLLGCALVALSVFSFL